MKKMKKIGLLVLMAMMIWCLAGSTGMAAGKVTLKLSSSRISLVKGKKQQAFCGFCFKERKNNCKEGRNRGDYG